MYTLYARVLIVFLCLCIMLSLYFFLNSMQYKLWYWFRKIERKKLSVITSIRRNYSLIWYAFGHILTTVDCFSPPLFLHKSITIISYRLGLDKQRLCVSSPSYWCRLRRCGSGFFIFDFHLLYGIRPRYSVGLYLEQI